MSGSKDGSETLKSTRHPETTLGGCSAAITILRTVVDDLSNARFDLGTFHKQGDVRTQRGMQDAPSHISLLQGHTSGAPGHL